MISWDLSVERADRKGLMTHAPVTEAHGARFPFAKEKETAIGLDEGRADSIFSPAAHFTGVIRFLRTGEKIIVTNVSPSVFFFFFTV